jgi:hypothetical protein
MIWQNPWAWAGLLAVGIPVLVHLLGRGRARVQQFPTLRFLDATRLLPTRRARLRDLLLLALRAGIVAVAVAALAQPLLLTPGRVAGTERALARAIVVDTSASMQRVTPAGERAVDAARREARRLAAQATTATLLESATPSKALAGASAWLNAHGSRGELVVLSDFQLGTLDSTDLAGAPSGIGVRLSRIELAPATGPMESPLRYGNADVTARVSLTADRTDAEWSEHRADAHPATSGILVLAGAGEQPRADAAVRAAQTIGVPMPVDTSHAIAIVFPQYEMRADLIRRATPLRAAWMTDIITRLRADPLLSASAHLAAPQTGVDDHDRLVLFSQADAGSPSSSALIAAAARALSIAPPSSELEPATLSDSVLAAWQRAPSIRAISNATITDSDGRWLWLVALLLLGLETLIRRAVAPSPVSRLPSTVS